MQITAIISEYNPFHNGHKHQIDLVKNENNLVIALMSSNFVQRGEPAIFDKFSRTKAALLSGVDLVLEYPSIFACQTAEDFASKAIKILNSSSIVDNLCFGCETNDLESLKEIALLLVSNETSKKLNIKYFLDMGLSFPKARQKALEASLGRNLDLLSYSNNILAIEYLKSIYKTKSTISPFAIKRIENNYKDTNISGSISSASSIRAAILQNSINDLKHTVPLSSFEIYQKLIEENKIHLLDNFSDSFNYKIRASNKDSLKNYNYMIEGLENRFLNHLENNYLISDLLKNVKTKRYTYTALSRLVLNFLLDIKKHDIEEDYIPYIRVLGFRKESQDLLANLLKNSKIPVVSNLKHARNILDDKAYNFLMQEVTFSNLHAMSAYNKKIKYNYELSKALVII